MKNPSMKTTTKIGVLLATAALPLGLTSCFSQSEADADAIRIALQFTPVADFSPFSDDAILNTQMGAAETLVAIDEDGEVQPKLAESFDVVDDKTVVFTLREGATFHDDSPVDAEAVAGSLNNIFGATTRPKGVGKADLSAEATGPREVTVRSAESDPILVQRFSDPGTIILAPGAYTGESPDPFGFGTGPYEMTEKHADGSLTLSAHPTYYNGAPVTQTLQVSFIEDGAARVNALRAGEQDLVRGVPIVSLNDLGDGAAVLGVDTARANLLHFNTDKGVFADAQLRRAVAAAIDATPVVADIFEGEAADPKGSLFNRSWEWANSAGAEISATTDAGADATATDADATEADATDAATTDAAALGEGKKIRLATWDSRPELPDTANLIADQLRKLGFEVELVVADYNSLEAQLLDGTFDAIVASRNYLFGAGDPVSFLETDFSCEGSYNLSQYCDRATDAKIAAAAKLATGEQRLEAAASIGRDIVEDGAVVSLAHERLHIGVQGVENVAVDALERYLVTEKISK